MDFFEVIESRRSIRAFTAEPVPRRLIEACLNASRSAPSGTNSQPWRFIVVRSPERRALLAEAGFNQPGLVQAPVITVLLGDRSIDKKRLRRAKELADIGAVSEDTLTTIETKYKDQSESKESRDARILVNCMLAGEHYALAATALGLGCCWVMLYDRDKAAAALNLDPKHNFPIAMLPTGYPAEEPPPRPRYALSEIAWDEEPNHPWMNELE